jgi:CRP-like cAMP-binding protein
MNEAINKSITSTNDARTGERASYMRPQLVAKEVKRVQNEMKIIPFDGLLTNKLLSAMSGEEFARLLPYMEPVAVSAGDYIYGFGNAVEFVYFPETAVISQIHLLEDGNTTEVALIGKEGMVGLSAIFDAPAMNYWTQAIAAGSALRIRADVIKEEFARASSLQQILLSYASLRIVQISQRAVCNGRHALSGKLCTWLLMIQDRVGDAQLVLTHEEIARHLGARRASISVAATYLKDRKIISYNRGHLQILDREALINSACECYRTLAQYSTSHDNRKNK